MFEKLNRNNLPNLNDIKRCTAIKVGGSAVKDLRICFPFSSSPTKTCTLQLPLGNFLAFAINNPPLRYLKICDIITVQFFIGLLS